MKAHLGNLTRLAALPVLSAALFAQTQIGGGTCASSTLNGSYSLTLSGRDLASSATLTAVSVGVGTATFDGLSKVTLTLTSNTAKSAGAAANLSGTYSLQANCIGTITINSGGSATFTLESYNQGNAYLITGQDGTYAYSGSGNTLPDTCSASQLNGTYSFNGNGFLVTASAPSGVSDYSGLLQFDGTKTVSGTWFITAGGSTKTVTTSGSYTVTAGCAGTASMTDGSGNAYAVQLTVTSAAGGFALGGSNPQMVFTGTGRAL